MRARRTIVWTIAILFGAATAVGTIAFFNTTIDKFSISNTILVFLSMGSLAFIWLDFILRTEYLRN
jgi:hypothetical protein